MPIDGKYGRVTLENQRNIGDDEPVIVFRAQDNQLVAVLDFYRQVCKNAGSPERHLKAIDDTKSTVVKWQAENHTQVPQSADYQPDKDRR